jgi:2-dehydro-3-deoxyphosphogalactonate aldolase
MALTLDAAMARCPLVAIIRGVKPEEAADIGTALVDAGFAIVEVPLNSPDPVSSIARIVDRLGDRALVGAGTVMSPADVADVAAAGGRLIVMPHSDLSVVRAAKAQGLYAVPGVFTPTEGFAALAAGADALKLFPAEAIPPQVVKAWRAVFPQAAKLLPVGGVGAGNMAAYLAAGAAGFGLGTSLYVPGRKPAEVRAAAETMIAAWKTAAASLAGGRS